MSEVDVRKRRRSRLILVTLFALAIAPVLGSYLLYFAVRDGGPWGTANRGELLAPGVSAGTLDVTTPAAQGATAELGGHWWLLLVADGSCRDDCALAADRLRALQILLNKDAPRLRRGLLVRAAGDDDGWSGLARNDPGLARLDGTFPQMTVGIYLIDPLGNVVLHYPYAAAGKPVLDDVKRLLKVSQIG